MKFQRKVWLRRPWKSELSFPVSLAGGVIMLCTYALSNTYLLQLGCGIAGSLLGATLCAILAGFFPLYLVPFPGGIVRKLGLRRVSTASLLRPAAGGFLCIFLFTEAVTPLWKKALQALGLPFEDQQPLLKLIAESSWNSRILLFLTVAAAVPVMEELFFRRYLNGLLRKAGGVTALFTGAAVFAAAHNFLPGIPSLFFMGIVFQLIYSQSRNFAAPVLCHAFVNAFAFIAVLLQ